MAKPKLKLVSQPDENFYFAFQARLKQGGQLGQGVNPEVSF